MPPPIYVELRGGLGNQMFQYAAGRAVSYSLGAPLRLDRTWYSGLRDDRQRKYELGVFPISAEIAQRGETVPLRRQKETWPKRLQRHLMQRPRRDPPTFVAEPSFRYWPGIYSLQGPVLLSGYWQSPRYFDQIANLIRTELAFPALSSAPACAISAKISKSETGVAVHIRRGDYLSPEHKELHGDCCSAEYYRRALDVLSPNGETLDLFLFSDDLDWVRENFETGRHRSTLVDVSAHREAPHHDMHLMSLMQFHIISNSTFSWWGAWLSQRSNKVVVAPKKWFRNHKDGTSAQDLIPSEWIRV